MIAPSGPNLEMFVLDAIQDDLENVESIMRYLREWQACWPHEFTVNEVTAALRRLIEGGHVEVFDATDERVSILELQEKPDLDEGALKECWFLPTASGRELWEAWDPPSRPQ